MLWRKNKSDAANEARAQLQQVRILIRRLVEFALTSLSPGLTLALSHCYDAIRNLLTYFPRKHWQPMLSHRWLCDKHSSLKPSDDLQHRYTYCAVCLSRSLAKAL